MKSLMTTIGILTALITAIIISMLIMKSNVEYIEKEIGDIEKLAINSGAYSAGEYMQNIEEDVMDKLKICTLFIIHSDIDQIITSYLRAKGNFLENNKSDAFVELEALKFLLDHAKGKDFPSASSVL